MSRKIEILGVKVDDISLVQLLEKISLGLETNDKLIITYANIYAANLAYKQPWFRNFLNHSSITLCDGFGIKLGATLIGRKINHRLTPPDFIFDVCSLALRHKARMFLLGAQPTSVEKAAILLGDSFRNLEIRYYHGYFDKTLGHEENDQVIRYINEFNPEILLVGFGMPIQEKWILDNIHQLNIKIIFAVGALIDYVSGDVFRVPRWLTDNGLEWLGRLMIEPGRLWRRYIIGNPLFFWRIFVHHCLKYSLPQ